MADNKKSTTQKKATSSSTKTGTSKPKSTPSNKKTASKSTTSTAKRAVKKDIDKAANRGVANTFSGVKTSSGGSFADSKIVKKALKKVPLTVKILAVFMFIVGALGGVFIGTTICSNDTFELIPCQTSFALNSPNEISIEGVKLISFGKDKSDKVQMQLSDGLTYDEKENIFTIADTSAEGMYYIIYTTTDHKFKDIKRIRYIYIVDMDAVGESQAVEG